MAYTREQFILEVAPSIQKNAKRTGILASVILAQAILESNNGNSGLTKEGNALFGIKADRSWRGKVWTGSTIEYSSGDRTSLVAGFRAYNSWEESIIDHSNFLMQNSRYHDLIGEKDYRKACQSLQEAGYATDPNYAKKLITLIEANRLNQYDVAIETKDQALASAVDKIIASGIPLQRSSWESKDGIKLSNVPALLSKLGGVDELVKEGVISQRVIWDEKRYTHNNVRSLLIKYAMTL